MELQKAREFTALRLIATPGNEAFDFGSLLSFQNGQSAAFHLRTTAFQELEQY